MQKFCLSEFLQVASGRFKLTIYHELDELDKISEILPKILIDTHEIKHI